MDENAHGNDTNQSADIDGRVNLPAAAGSIRRQEADERDGDEAVDLIGPYLLAEAELLLQEHDEDEQGRDERRGVADEERLEARVVGPSLEDGVPRAVAVLGVVPEAARRAEAGDVRDARRERGQQHEHLAEPLRRTLFPLLYLSSSAGDLEARTKWATR